MRKFDEFIVKQASMESPNEAEKKQMHEEETAIDQPVTKDECCGKGRKSKLSDKDKHKLLKMLNLADAIKE